MKIPTRPAPSIPIRETRKETFTTNRTNGHEKRTQTVLPKKKPPPRPPPPKFKTSTADKIDWPEPSTSTSLLDMPIPCSLGQKPEFATSLIDLSTTNKEELFPTYAVANKNLSVGNSSFYNDLLGTSLIKGTSMINISDTNKPTIIRAKPPTKICMPIPKVVVTREGNYSPPMPTVPPPSPPKCVDNTNDDFITSYGVALYNYEATHKEDLGLQVNDIVIIIHEINDDWLYGKVGDNEGLFPKNFIDIKVPYKFSSENTATALYTFNPETSEDLKLTPGQKVTVLKRISAEWLYGESDGLCGQFPTNFINTVPPGF